MIVKLGDLVQLKGIRVNGQQEIWLVVGLNGFNDYITIKNIHTGYTCQHNVALLKHFKTDKK